MKKLLSKSLITFLMFFILSVGLSVAEDNRSPDSERWKPYFKEADKFYDQGKYNEAVNSLGKAIAIDGNAAAPHYMLAMIYEKQGKNQQAISEWETFINLSSHKELVQKARIHLERLRRPANE
jgi:Tfp pilus assembly protein PilF